MRMTETEDLKNPLQRVIAEVNMRDPDEEMTMEQREIFESKCLLQYQESHFVFNAEHPPTLAERPMMSPTMSPTNTPCLCAKRLLLAPVESVRTPAGKTQDCFLRKRTIKGGPIQNIMGLNSKTETDDDMVVVTSEEQGYVLEATSPLRRQKYNKQRSAGTIRYIDLANSATVSPISSPQMWQSLRIVNTPNLNLTSQRIITSTLSSSILRLKTRPTISDHTSEIRPYSRSMAKSPAQVDQHFPLARMQSPSVQRFSSPRVLSIDGLSIFDEALKERVSPLRSPVSQRFGSSNRAQAKH